MTRADRRMHRERKTMEAMIRLYCRGVHQSDGGPHDELCTDCADLQAFANLRLTKCPYQEDKPTCANCPIHCYKPDRREQMKAVMRYAGPRMMWKHPIMAIRHLLDGRREAPPLPKRGTRTRTADD